MFRPPPTVVEIGTEEDMKQYEEIVEKKSTPVTPPVKQRTIFESPDVIRKQRQIITTPSGSIDSPN